MAVKNTTEPRLVEVTVSPGDFGTKYLTLRKGDGGINREVDPEYARRLFRSSEWGSICKHGRLRLVDLGDGTFLILDGQHRIYGASEFGTSLCTMYADIVPMSFLDAKPGDLVVKINKVKTYRVKDCLFNKSTESIWPLAFEKAGLTPAFKNTTRAMCWPNVMRGLYNGLSVWESRSFPGQTPRSSDELLELWLTKDAALVKKAAMIMAWWGLGADAAVSGPGVTSLHSSMAYAFAYVLWCSNTGEPVARSEAPMRLAHWSHVAKLQGMTSWVNWKFWELMLEGINASRQKHLLQLSLTSVNAGKRKK